MEKQFFEWKDWDDIGVGQFQFYDVTLKVKLGKFPAGEKFNEAYISYEDGQLVLYRDGKEVGLFKLALKAKAVKEF